MILPDPNVGYVFGYSSEVYKEGIVITFLKGLIKIVFRYEDIEIVKITTYKGGRISWNVIRWGKCPNGTKALQIRLKRGIFRNHLIVFENLDEAVERLRKYIEVSE